MNGNGRRQHLIERAAIRLDGVVQHLERESTVDSARPYAAAAPDTREPTRSSQDGRPIVDRRTLERAGMIDWRQSGNRVAEEFRIALNEILRQRASIDPGGATRPGLIMVTSALPGEGKSFTALNLAVGIARHGEQRVLLIDGDGGKGGLGDLLGVSAGTSLAVAPNGGGFELAGLGVRTFIDNLDFLRLGDSADDSDDAASAMMTAISAIAGRGEDRIVLIDAPPCLSSSRSHLLAPLVGQTVLVVAAGSTQQGDIDAALGMIRSCPGISLLLNRVPRWQAHSFGSYGGAA